MSELRNSDLRTPATAGLASRREWLGQAAGGLLLAVLALPLPALALPSAARAFLKQRFGDGPIRFERVAVTLPALAENGNSVAFGVLVDSPMTPEDQVARLDVFAPDNPNPHIAQFRFTSRSGRAAVRTRVRLAASQTVIAVAQLADGTRYGGSAEIVVTEAACLDFLI